MRNVHIGWGPVGMTKIKTQSKPKLQLNKVNYTGKLDSEFKLIIISDYEVAPVWQSSNEDIVKVDQDGNITLVGEGTAVITVTSGKLVGRCSIKVVLSKEQQFEKDLKAGKVVLTTSITKTAVVSNKTSLSLNNQTLMGELFTESNGQILEGNSDSYAIWVKEGGEITINGDGEVRSQDARYSIAVWAQGGEVIINGGKYYNEGEGSDLIYASAGGKVYIYGGEFYPNSMQEGVAGTANDYSALNIKDSDRATSEIVVYGGKFYNFNPADNVSEGPGTNFVAEGYESVEIEPNVWEVRKIKSIIDETKIYYGTITPNLETFTGYSDFTEQDLINAINNGTLKAVQAQEQENLTAQLTEFQALVVLIPTNSKLKAFKSELGNEFPFAEKNTGANLHSNGEIIVGDFKVYGELVTVFNFSGEYLINIHE